jgi:pimeloyl-ACP methyl ester carboxylesterase/membrane-associated phospholipid phosphatase
MKTIIRLSLLLTFVLPCNARVPDAPPDAQLLVAWNARLLATAEAEDRFLTLKGVRSAAMMHLAIHDAINAIDPRFRPYALDVDGRGADPIAAATQAAFAIASDQYPAQRDQWESLRGQWLHRVRDPQARAAGIALGDAAAQAVLSKRKDDRWDATASYQFHPMAPGVYAEFNEHSGTPQGFVFGAGWAGVEPFALQSPAQFRSPPPPAINSAEYTRAYDEVRTVGRFESRARTADQTHLAFWWKEFAEASHNRLARQLVADEQPDLWTAARLFALLNVSIMDAYIGVFDNKFFYNHWRPYTAIRWAAHDGNPRTRAEPDWNNTHRHTYAFPSYPSAHGTACAAAMTVFADTFGDERWFRMVTPQVDSAGPLSAKMAMKPATRSFDSFSEAARECAWSRVYLGIHFRYDSIEGNRLGKRIGRYALRTMLAPLDIEKAQPWKRAVFQGVTLEYRLVGAGLVGASDPVVFIHGGVFADGLEPLSSAPALVARHRVLTWRRVGYARSGPAPGNAAIASQSAQLAQLMQHLGLPRAHIVGHSSGGLIALQFALDHPDRVRSLALLEPALPIPGVANPGIAQAVRIYQNGDRAGAIDAFMRAVAGADWREHVERELPLAFRQALSDAPAFFEQELPAVQAWQFGEAEARRILVPALAVTGGDSGKVSASWPARQAFLLQNLPDVEAFVLDDSSHMLALERPHALAARILEFFSNAVSEGGPRWRRGVTAGKMPRNAQPFLAASHPLLRRLARRSPRSALARGRNRQAQRLHLVCRADLR